MFVLASSGVFFSMVRVHQCVSFAKNYYISGKKSPGEAHDGNELQLFLNANSKSVVDPLFTWPKLE